MDDAAEMTPQTTSSAGGGGNDFQNFEETHQLLHPLSHHTQVTHPPSSSPSHSSSRKSSKKKSHRKRRQGSVSQSVADSKYSTNSPSSSTVNDEILRYGFTPSRKKGKKKAPSSTASSYQSELLDDDSCSTVFTIEKLRGDSYMPTTETDELRRQRRELCIQDLLDMDQMMQDQENKRQQLLQEQQPVAFIGRWTEKKMYEVFLEFEPPTPAPNTVTAAATTHDHMDVAATTSSAADESASSALPSS
ncbi:hypothetical protein MRX96_002498 [Rhipicephalus microplus]